MSEFVKSLQRLYIKKLISDEILQKLIESDKINSDEYQFIINI